MPPPPAAAAQAVGVVVVAVVGVAVVLVVGVAGVAVATIEGVEAGAVAVAVAAKVEVVVAGGGAAGGGAGVVGVQGFDEPVVVVCGEVGVVSVGGVFVFVSAPARLGAPRSPPRAAQSGTPRTRVSVPWPTSPPRLSPPDASCDVQAFTRGVGGRRARRVVRPRWLVFCSTHLCSPRHTRRLALLSTLHHPGTHLANEPMPSSACVG